MNPQMNDARSSTTLIDSSKAATLMEPLTDLVIRAGAAILAVNRAAMKVDGKLDGSPVTEADLAADRIIAEAWRGSRPRFRRCPRSASTRPSRRYTRQLLPDRSARRHQGIRRRPQRIHGQSCAGDAMARRCSASSARRRSDCLARIGRPRRRTADDSARRGQARRADPHPPLARSRGEPWIAAVSRSHGDAGPKPSSTARPGAIRSEARFGGQIRPGRRRRGRHLSAARADLRMGCRGRPCGRHRGRRQDHGRARRRPLQFGSGRDRFHRAGIHRLGRSDRGG